MGARCPCGAPLGLNISSSASSGKLQQSRSVFSKNPGFRVTACKINFKLNFWTPESSLALWWLRKHLIGGECGPKCWVVPLQVLFMFGVHRHHQLRRGIWLMEPGWAARSEKTKECHVTNNSRVRVQRGEAETLWVPRFSSGTDQVAAGSPGTGSDQLLLRPSGSQLRFHVWT